MAEPDWLTERELSAWRGFLTMQEDLRRRLNRQLVHDSGLSYADYAVLATLSDATDRCLRVFELREALRWEKTRLTHQISRMAARGLVQRETSADDSRGQVVAMTTEGYAAILKAAPGHAATVRRLFFDALSPRQVDTLATLSAAVLENIADRDPD
ncbi:MarR family winged helix-turn-helix transcriptional regulator [Asanoa siamensis]|uniref:MarR family transcriptional regulator n=1 Tax=Asanoa siamensis TaxID=926357 RepID=A0ABQ4CUY2_9ACTN|nr:MarR family winged helix-turn-helix transcriptional regulator [Asanoa siamensis]GIF74662.1 MarR family transcriptional regulator [Asanoa siamensis]